MNKRLNKYDVRELIDNHQYIIDSLNNVIDGYNSLSSSIIKFADEGKAKSIITTLRTVPVEELNREHRGFRIKTIKDAGLNTVADVYCSGTYRLSNINGISEYAAYDMYSVAEQIYDEVKNSAKIRISSDNKNAITNELIKALYKYKKTKELEEPVRDLLFVHEYNTKTKIKDLQCATNGIRCFFASKDKKERAIKAYDELIELFHDEDYIPQAKSLIKEANRIQRISAKDAWDDFDKDSISTLNTLEEVYPGALGNNDSTYGLPKELADEIEDQCFFPEGLHCTLRKYQEWGVKYILHQERVLLGDEMGLGKTIQAIATMVSLKNTGATHFVVVCPLSVLINWYREVKKFSSLSAHIGHGKEWRSALYTWNTRGGVFITTYEAVGKFETEGKTKVNLLVVDEAHYIKNPEAARTINCKKIGDKAERVLFMTGTALENKVDEMINLMEMLQPRIADSARLIAFMASAKEFRDKVAPVYYRRKRDDVLSELPDLIEEEAWCALNTIEEMAYESAILNHKYADARRVSWLGDNLDESCKCQRLKEIVDEAKSDGRKVIVFSFFLDTINKVRKYFASQSVDVINGSVSSTRRQEIIDRFEDAPAGTILPAQIIVGGTGLNIQAASVVVICEPQFKPSTENQAISRAYRMGQSRNVLVFRLLCAGTIDERMMDLLHSKQEIFNAFADKSTAAEKNKEVEIDENSFGEIIKDEIERINKKKSGVNSLNEENQEC